MDNIAKTRITKKGLLKLRELNLVKLNIGKDIFEAGENGYSDEEAFLVARNFPNIEMLNVCDNSIGEEGVDVVASSLAKMSILNINDNHNIRQKCHSTARLPHLEHLHVCICGSIQITRS